MELPVSMHELFCVGIMDDGEPEHVGDASRERVGVSAHDIPVKPMLRLPRQADEAHDDRLPGRRALQD